MKELARIDVILLDDVEKDIQMILKGNSLDLSVLYADLTSSLCKQISKGIITAAFNIGIEDFNEDKNG